MLGRESFLTSVEWEDGWPVVASPTLGNEVRSEEFVDDFTSGELDSGWISRRQFPSEIADFTSLPGALTLSGRDTTLHAAKPAFVGRRQRHHRCEAETTVAAVSGEAGLAVVYDEHSHYRVGVDADGVFAAASIGSMTHEIGRRPHPAGSLTLRVQMVAGMGGPDQVQLSFDTETGESVQLASIDGRYLSSEVVGGFLGRVMGVYAAGGDASFERYRYVGE